MSAERQLVERSLSGDRDAYRVLFETSYRRVFSVVARLVGNQDDAEDLVQEAYVQAYQKLGSFRGQASFATWVCGIAVNLAKRRMGLRRREVVLPLDGGNNQDGKLDLLDRDVVRSAVLELPEHHRQVVILRFYEGLSYQEIAKELGCPLKTVGSRLHHAVKALRTKLAGEWEG